MAEILLLDSERVLRMKRHPKPYLQVQCLQRTRFLVVGIIMKENKKRRRSFGADQ